MGGEIDEAGSLEDVVFIIGFFHVLADEKVQAEPFKQWLAQNRFEKYPVKILLSDKDKSGLCFLEEDSKHIYCLDLFK